MVNRKSRNEIITIIIFWSLIYKLTIARGLLYDRATKVIPGGVNSPIRFFNPFPFFAASANGSRINSIDHVSFVDYCMGYGSLLLGHANEEILKAVKLQTKYWLSLLYPHRKGGCPRRNDCSTYSDM